LKEIRDSLMAQDMGGHNIGIFNVHKRIRLFFGAEYGLSIDSHPAAGTIVQLTVPRARNAGLPDNSTL
jgi:two-component system, sensor histidine kinase YesM